MDTTTTFFKHQPSHCFAYFDENNWKDVLFGKYISVVYPYDPIQKMLGLMIEQTLKDKTWKIRREKIKLEKIEVKKLNFKKLKLKRLD